MAGKSSSRIGAAFSRPDQGAAGITAEDTAPKRITVDLDPGLHEDVQEWMGARYRESAGGLDMANVVRDMFTELAAHEPKPEATAFEALLLERARDRVAAKRAARVRRGGRR